MSSSCCRPSSMGPSKQSNFESALRGKAARQPKCPERWVRPQQGLCQRRGAHAATHGALVCRIQNIIIILSRASSWRYPAPRHALHGYLQSWREEGEACRFSRHAYSYFSSCFREPQQQERRRRQTRARTSSRRQPRYGKSRRRWRTPSACCRGRGSTRRHCAAGVQQG